MDVAELLRKLKLGSSVAEHDDALERYFIETDTFRALVSGEKDIIAGDKGTGKTAIYKILQTRYTTLSELSQVEVVAAFNPAGNPVFQRLAEGDPLEEGQYITVWKAYFLALAGNWVLALNEEAFSHKMTELDRLLSSTGLRSADDTPNTVFSRIVNLFRRISDPKAVEAAITLGPNGIPILTPRIELGEGEPSGELVEHDYALGVLNDVIRETGVSVWLVLDRLDEAFQGFPRAEVPALRALLRTYLDLLELDHLRLKLFLRKDLFRRVIAGPAGGFVNLTHVNARKIEIIWDEEDLFELLARRISDNADFLEELGLQEATSQEIFDTVSPRQVDQGDRKPTTWAWMISRIRDGNGIAPPRNLIDLVTKAHAAELRRQARESREVAVGEPLISSDSIKRGLQALSQERVEDTLLAEAGDYAPTIERFRGGKAEHNEESLATLLEVAVGEVRTAVTPLVELGFLEKAGESYKVPMLYREGLSITQGKAFASDEQDETADES